MKWYIWTSEDFSCIFIIFICTKGILFLVNLIHLRQFVVFVLFAFISCPLYATFINKEWVLFHVLLGTALSMKKFYSIWMLHCHEDIWLGLELCTYLCWCVFSIFFFKFIYVNSIWINSLMKQRLFVKKNLFFSHLLSQMGGIVIPKTCIFHIDTEW